MAAIFGSYGVGATLFFPLIGSGTNAFSTAASGSLVGTNVRVYIDGASATSTNTGTHIPGGGVYRLILTTTEMTGKQIMVVIAQGSASNVVETQAVYIETYGNVSAQHQINFGLPLGSQTIGTVTFVAGSVDLRPNQATSTIGTVSVLLTGTVTTVTNVVSANAVQLLGTAIPGTDGIAQVNVQRWLGTLTTGAAGTAIVNLVASQAGVTVGTVNAILTGTVTTVTNVISANAVQLLGTAIPGTDGIAQVNVQRWLGTLTTGAAGTAIVNLVASQAGVTVGTVNSLLTGTVTTVTNVISANAVQLLGTAIPGTDGIAQVNVQRWLGTLTTGNAGTAVVNLVLSQSGVTVGTVNALLTGTVTTVTSIVSADVRQILGTAAVAAAGTFTNIGTVTSLVSANVVQIDGSATAAANLGRAAGVLASGSTTGTITASAFETDLTQTGTAHWNGRVVIFLSGTMQFQASDITGYTGSGLGTLGRLLVTTLSVTPAAGVTFIVV